MQAGEPQVTCDRLIGLATDRRLSQIAAYGRNVYVDSFCSVD